MARDVVTSQLSTARLNTRAYTSSEMALYGPSFKSLPAELSFGSSEFQTRIFGDWIEHNFIRDIVAHGDFVDQNRNRLVQLQLEAQNTRDDYVQQLREMGIVLPVEASAFHPDKISQIIHDTIHEKSRSENRVLTTPKGPMSWASWVKLPFAVPQSTIFVHALLQTDLSTVTGVVATTIGAACVVAAVNVVASAVVQAYRNLTSLRTFRSQGRAAAGAWFGFSAIVVSGLAYATWRLDSQFIYKEGAYDIFGKLLPGAMSPETAGYVAFAFTSVLLMMSIAIAWHKREGAERALLVRDKISELFGRCNSRKFQRTVREYEQLEREFQEKEADARFRWLQLYAAVIGMKMGVDENQVTRWLYNPNCGTQGRNS